MLAARRFLSSAAVRLRAVKPEYKKRLCRVAVGGGVATSAAVFFSSGDLASKVSNEWNEMRPSTKIICGTVALNGVLMVGWWIPALRPFMSRHFVLSLDNLQHGRVHVLLTSVFSHSSLMHFLFNSVALISFAPSLCDSLGRTSTALAYLGGGLAGSMASLANKMVRSSVIGSIGSSGALMSLLAMFVCEFPDNRLMIIFLPTFSFSAVHGLIGLALFDTAGLLLGWRMLDHAAHLGGLSLGLLLSKFRSDQHHQIVRGNVMMKTRGGQTYEGTYSQGHPAFGTISKEPDYSVTGWFDSDDFDLKKGTGRMRLKDGSTYVGEIGAGFTMHGRGTVHLPDGSRYEGQWEHGSPVGIGVAHSPTGAKYRCRYVDGKLERV